MSIKVFIYRIATCVPRSQWHYMLNRATWMCKNPSKDGYWTVVWTGFNYLENVDRIEQIKRAILHIEERLCERIPIQELAHDVFASRFHFHRLFKKVTGSSVYQYILCRKLSESSKWLLETDKSVGAIADAIGFESHEGFCRAFKNRIGVSPSIYRNSGQRFSFMPALDLDTGSLRCGVIREPRTIQYAGVLLAGIDVHGYSRTKVAEAWFHLLSQAKSIPYLTDRWDSYGILRGNSWDHESEKYCFAACKQVAQVSSYPAGIHALKIPSGTYIQTMVRGRRKDFTDFYRALSEQSGITENSWIIEYQDEYFLSPEISPRMVMAPIRK